jgi:polyhydroxybutyrate depolymerase
MQMRRSKAAYAIAAAAAAATLAACTDDDAGKTSVDTPVPVSTTVTDTQVLTNGRAYAQCVRDQAVPGFPEPVVRNGRLAWSDPATAQRATQALRSAAARNGCQAILDPMPANRLWPDWAPPEGEPSGLTSRSTGCDQPPPTGPGASTRQTMVSAGGNRTYLLHLPHAYNKDAGFPVVLALHGATSQAAPNIIEDMEKETRLSELADREGFIVVYPRSTTVDGGRTGWNTGSEDDPTVDDVRFVNDLLDRLNETVCVDPRRVYATGFSSGGGMTGILACRAADRITAFAAVSGAFFASRTPCAPARPVPIMEFHGTSDKVPYEGGPFGPDTPTPIPQWLAEWAERDQCTSGPTTFFQMIDVIAERWGPCAGRSTVIGYRILNGGHTWPGEPEATQTVNASSLAWNFFRTQHLP